ncbi:hypothetical protein V6N13_090385 [Hibiscus sabdariffa]|uniref:BHLH domain-containing protein n=1 Tax=Hibiscus sabdariffa TaxID=183260 RepID=A0ABR2C0G3_9ROSI
MASPTTPSRTNRNLIERERRSQMRSLLLTLFSLLPPHPRRMSMPDLVENATIYIKQLQERVEELSRRKAQLVRELNGQPRAVGDETIIPLVLEISDSESESTVQVDLIAGTGTTIALCDIVTILEEEGAEIVNVTYHNDGNRIILSVHSQAAYSRIGIEISRVRERLQNLQISRKISPATAESRLKL